MDILDINGNALDVTIFIYKPDGEKIVLSEFFEVGNGIYSCAVPSETDFIYGDTTYIWGVEATDGLDVVTMEFQYKTCGSRYDVNNDGRVNFADFLLTWMNRDSRAPYNGIYDVNHNGMVNFQDVGLIYRNMD